MQHWAGKAEEALAQAHNRHFTSAGRVEALRLASRAESRATRLADLLRAATTARWMRGAA
ncbi:hypothetical protein D9M68_882220 [compost metagenome]